MGGFVFSMARLSHFSSWLFLIFSFCFASLRCYVLYIQDNWPVTAWAYAQLATRSTMLTAFPLEVRFIYRRKLMHHRLFVVCISGSTLSGGGDGRKLAWPHSVGQTRTLRFLFASVSFFGSLYGSSGLVLSKWLLSLLLSDTIQLVRRCAYRVSSTSRCFQKGRCKNGQLLSLSNSNSVD